MWINLTALIYVCAHLPISLFDSMQTIYEHKHTCRDKINMFIHINTCKIHFQNYNYFIILIYSSFICLDL